MTSDNHTPKNLFAKREPDRERSDFDQFLSEVFGASERAGAIVSAAQIEDTLAEAIKGRLREMSDGDIGVVFTGQASPLNTFHAKIHMGFALALYDQGVREDLLVIKDVRNRFAHHIPTKSFDDGIIKQLCEKLHYPYHRVHVEERVFKEDPIEAEETDPRRRFQGVVGNLYFGLAMMAVNEVRPVPPTRWREALDYARRPASPAQSQKKARVRPSRGTQN